LKGVTKCSNSVYLSCLDCPVHKTTLHGRSLMHTIMSDNALFVFALSCVCHERNWGQCKRRPAQLSSVTRADVI
jgi:hypothetical protein